MSKANCMVERPEAFRLEPLIIVVVAVIMIFANLVVVYLSANKIITSSVRMLQL